MKSARTKAKKVKTPKKRGPKPRKRSRPEISDSSFEEDYRATNTPSKGDKRGQSNISSRLRKRTPTSTPRTQTSKFEARKTRSMMKSNSAVVKSNQKSKRGRKKRESKYADKGLSDLGSSFSDEAKSADPTNSIRRLFLATFGSIYQAYDEYLQKRKRNRKAEFIKLIPEPGEEILKPTKRKNMMKLAIQKRKENEDTF